MKSYMKTVPIFQGKQAEYNEKALILLYDNGPLTAWEITGKIRKIGKQSLHATLNKRLRDLEKKGYLRKAGKQWCLRFKGIIAVLLIQPKPKMWNSKWTDIFEKYTKSVEKQTQTVGDAKIVVGNLTIKPFETLNQSYFHLRALDQWLALSERVKTLMQTGVINFDIITDETLLTYIISSFPIEQIKDYVNELTSNKNG